MADYPYFPLYVEDLAMGTAAMSPTAVGIYMRCLCFQWSHGHVPDDATAIARLAGALPAEVAEAWEAVRSKFAASGPGKLQNARLERERVKIVDLVARRSEAGKAGAAARHGKRSGSRTSKRTATVEPLPKQTDRGGTGKTLARASDSDSVLSSDSKSQKAKAVENKPELPMKLPELSEFPEPVRDKECRDAWHHWLIYKATKIRKPYKTERGHRAELVKAASSGRAAFLGAIALSMDREWLGVRLDLFLSGEGSTASARSTREVAPI
jgi:uncharacterized protein YdaU (DUF1376 family)